MAINLNEVRAKQLWLALVAGGKLPADIPTDPDVAHGEAWKGWCAWLGVAPNGFFDVAETKARLEAAIDATNDEIAKIRDATETSATPEKVETELKGLLEPPAEAPTSDELSQDRDERPAVHLAERNFQLVEPAAEPAKVEKMDEYGPLSDEQAWWRRLVGWIRTRCGGAPRKRLRESL